MKRKMIRLALAAWCPCRGASGFLSSAPARPAKARYPKPAAALFNICRRVIRGVISHTPARVAAKSIDKPKLRAAKHRQANGTPGFEVRATLTLDAGPIQYQEVQSRLSFRSGRRTP